MHGGDAPHESTADVGHKKVNFSAITQCVLKHFINNYLLLGVPSPLRTDLPLFVSTQLLATRPRLHAVTCT
jgi:hypothetical protein